MKEPSVLICSEASKKPDLSILCSSFCPSPLARAHPYKCPVPPSQSRSPGQTLQHTRPTLRHPFLVLPAALEGVFNPHALVTARLNSHWLALLGFLQHGVYYRTSRHYTFFCLEVHPTVRHLGKLVEQRYSYLSAHISAVVQVTHIQCYSCFGILRFFFLKPALLVTKAYVSNLKPQYSQYKSTTRNPSQTLSFCRT